jgi:hypothetical protein
MSAAVVHIGPALAILSLAAIVFAIYVIVDMARRPGWQWRQAGSNKVLWLVLEIVGALGLLAIVVGILYLVWVRPRLVAVERQGPAPPGVPGVPDAWAPMTRSTVPGAWAPPPEPGAAPAGTAAGTPGSQPPAYPPGAEGALPPVYPSAPAPPPASLPAFGWYPDPSGRFELRYWDGTRWTEHVSVGGEQSSDPVPGQTG